MQTFAGDRLLRLQFLPPRLTGAVNRDSLGNVLQELLQDVDLQTRALLWFSTAFFSCSLRILENVFPKHRIV